MPPITQFPSQVCCHLETFARCEPPPIAKVHYRAIGNVLDVLNLKGTRSVQSIWTVIAEMLVDHAGLLFR
jgi:hypothetical protein